MAPPSTSLLSPVEVVVAVEPEHEGQPAGVPVSFGGLTIGGDLDLSDCRHDNKLESLPASFGSHTIGGDQDLCNNPVAENPTRAVGG